MATIVNASLNLDSNNNPIGIINPQTGLLVGNLQEFIPATNDYAGILAAYNAAVANGGGVVKLLPVTYQIGANTLPITSGVSYIGIQPSISNPYGNAPDINATYYKGTIINGTGIAMKGGAPEGAQFNGSITSGVLTVTAININPTGNYGTINIGSTITGTNVPFGDNVQPQVLTQLTATNTASATPTFGSGGASGTYTVTVSSATGIVVGQFVSGTNIPANTYVSVINGTIITLTNAFSGQASGTISFYTANKTGTYRLGVNGAANTTLTVASFTNGVSYTQASGAISPTGVTIQDICFTNVATAIQVGSFNSGGFSFSKLTNLMCFGSTNKAFLIYNFEHIEVDGIFCWYCADSMSFTMYAASPWGNLGNSKITKIYNQNSGNTPNATYGYPKGIEIGVPLNNPNGAGIGSLELNVSQNNHYNRIAVTDTFTFNGTANIALSSTTASSWPVGMPVRFGTSTSSVPGAGNYGQITYNPTKGNTANTVITGGTTYFVTASGTASGLANNSTIQIAVSQKSTAITPSTGSLAAIHWGYPHISFRNGSCNANEIDIEGPAGMLLIDGIVGNRISQNYIGHDQGESVVVRNSFAIELDFPNLTYLDTSGYTNTNQLKFNNGQVNQLANVSGGDGILGSFYDGDNGATPSISLAQNRTTTPTGKQLPSLLNVYTGSGDFTYPGSALGVRQGAYPGNYPYVNPSSDLSGFGVFTNGGGASGYQTFTWNGTFNSTMKGFRQTFKNVGNIPLRVVLSSNGTFDGLTTGTSSGTTIALMGVNTVPTSLTNSTPVAAAGQPGGSLTMVCCDLTGGGSMQWCIENFYNCAWV